MKAWMLEGFAGLKGLNLRDVEDPDPAPGEIIVRVHYAALNPADRFLSEGQYPARPHFPHILGRDGMGTVVCRSPECDGFNDGDRVVVLRSEIGVSRWGTLAQYVAVPAESLAPVPDGWTDEEAAAGPLVYLTAYQALTQWGPVPEGSVVLVTGASGGVGVATTQLAKAMNLRPLGLSRSPDKRKQVEQLGAEKTFDPESPDWSDQVKKHLGKKRVDLAVDSVAGKSFSGVISTLGDQGKVSVVGRSAGPVPEFNTASLFFRRNKIGGVAVGAYTPPESQAAWKEIVRLLSQTNSRPVIDRVCDFEDLIAAFEALERGPMGKVLVRVSD